jgi:branched-chain amino acid transport system ATP-binding protein
VLAERNQAGGTLSGGEQQMLAIARAMMLEPRHPPRRADRRAHAAHGLPDPQIIEVLHRDGRDLLVGRTCR